MKKIFFPLLFFTFLLVSCNNQSKTSEAESRTLVGHWEPVDVKGEELSENDRKEILEGGYMEFDRDGKFLIQGREGSQFRMGSFNYDENTKALKLTSGDEEKNYSVEWVSNSQMILIVQEENIRITFNKDKSKAGVGKTNDETTDEEKKTGESIAGIWKPVEVISDKMNEEEKDELLTDAVVEFTTSGSYISTSRGETKYGKYFLEPGKLKLETEGRTQVVDFERVSPDRIILRDENGTVTLHRKN